jgi:hypothetical protein
MEWGLQPKPGGLPSLAQEKIFIWVDKKLIIWKDLIYLLKNKSLFKGSLIWSSKNTNFDAFKYQLKLS